MAESISHINLVEQLVKAIEGKFNIDSNLALVDHPESRYKPTKINGYIPDYFLFNRNSSILIIGEAKTINDVNRKHTIEQVTAFLKECNKYTNSVFVFATPWQMSNFSKGMIEKICKENTLNVKTIILESLREI